MNKLGGQKFKDLEKILFLNYFYPINQNTKCPICERGQIHFTSKLAFCGFRDCSYSVEKEYLQELFEKYISDKYRINIYDLRRIKFYIKL